MMLNEKQYAGIINALSQTDWMTFWLTIVAQFVAIFIAVLTGWYFQKIFRDEDRRKQAIDEAHKFNEALTRIGAFLEVAITNAGQVLPQYAEESRYDLFLSARLNQRNAKRELTMSCQYFPHLELVESSEVIGKIPNAGKYPDVLMAFHRMRNSIQTFNIIISNRNDTIVKFTASEGGFADEYIHRKHGEILQRTGLLISQIEGILDACLYITQRFENIGIDVKSELDSKKIPKNIVASGTKNPTHYRLLQELNALSDQIVGSTTRYRHIKAEEIARNSAQ